LREFNIVILIKWCWMMLNKERLWFRVLAVRCRVEREGVESGRGMGILGRERL
jgi:hypothetical protein